MVLSFSDTKWSKLLTIGVLIDRIFNLILFPFLKSFQNLTTRLPKSSLWFRPSFLNELYMALGLWEPYVKREFKPKLGDTVVDVGAHIGYYTLMASKAVGPKGKVIAIEPDPRNISVLRKNIKANKLQNVELVNCAIGSIQGTTTFQMKKNPLLSELVSENDQDNESYIEVSVKTIDRLCNDLELDHIDWIKIDVEGGALDVLKGASESINTETTILIEIPDDETLHFLENAYMKPRKLLKSISKYGYWIAGHTCDLPNST